MKKLSILFLTLIFIFMLTGCTSQETANSNEPVTLAVSAAQTLENALNEIKPAFEQANPGITLDFTFGNANDLAIAIQKGSVEEVSSENSDGTKTNVKTSADFFIASSQKTMTILEDENLIVPSTRKDFVTNPLVLIVGEDSMITGIDSIMTDDVVHLAIGEPTVVPAGQYAVDALNSLGYYTTAEPKLIYGRSVAQVIQYVANGEAQAGIVYKTDVINDPSVKIVAEFPLNSYSAITYPMAQIAGTDHSAQIAKFEDFLLSNKAQQIMQKYGFAPPIIAASSVSE